MTAFHRRLVPIIGLLLIAFGAAACSGGDGNTMLASSLATTTTAAESSSGPGPVATLTDVRGAVVRIVAEGSFAEPGAGMQYNSAGSGSGFIIDSSGIAVTNNHVVGGAAFLEVYFADDPEPRNARILGISECSDLAVIDIEGDGYPYLEWSTAPLIAGTEIYAAGFPLGDPEYTLLDGIISKEDAFGESDWASIDRVIEHSADTLPGNSGGPIVDTEGRVLAVNYAGDSYGQSFGIARDEAIPVIEQLRGGVNVDSIGINGYALAAEGFAGIWVSSVEAGTPADNAGVRAGDLITLIEGIIPATDGTMSDFCDVLRTNSPDDEIAIEVFREADGAFYEGTLNGRALASLSGPDAFIAAGGSSGGDPSGDEPELPPGTPYAGYEVVYDDSGSLTVEVPTAWSDRNTSAWVMDGEPFGLAITASTNADAFNQGWDYPGVFVGASSDLVDWGYTAASYAAEKDFSGACVSAEVGPYDDGWYTGEYQIWTDCGDAGSWFIVIVAEDAERSTIFLVEVVLATDADSEAFQRIVDSFALVGEIDAGAAAPGGGYGSPIDLTAAPPGTCFNDADWADDLSTIVPVSCDEYHDNEIISQFEYSDQPWPGEAALDEAASEDCLAEFPGYVGTSFESSVLQVFPVYPVEEVWNTGDRLVTCVVYHFDYQQLLGSMYQSGY